MVPSSGSTGTPPNPKVSSSGFGFFLLFHSFEVHAELTKNGDSQKWTSCLPGNRIDFHSIILNFLTFANHHRLECPWKTKNYPTVTLGNKYKSSHVYFYSCISLILPDASAKTQSQRQFLGIFSTNSLSFTVLYLEWELSVINTPWFSLTPPIQLI